MCSDIVQIAQEFLSLVMHIKYVHMEKRCDMQQLDEFLSMQQLSQSTTQIPNKTASWIGKTE